MNQSTSFAQVATNQFDYLSSALCANTPPCKKHSSSRKFLTLSISLRLLLVMFMTLMVSVEVWSANANHTCSNTSGTIVSSKITFTTTSATWNSPQCRIAANGSITFTLTGVSVTKIAMGFSSSGYVGSWTSSGGGSFTTSSTNVTWSGSANPGTLTFTTSSAARLKTISVTYETAASYTVTWTINPAAGGSLSPTSGTSTTVTPNVAYTYDSPAYTVTPAGKANVSQDGDNFTATPSANCTIQINMVAKPTYTVNWYVNETKEHSQIDVAGTTLTNIPDLKDYECGGKVFVGWTTQPSYEHATDAPNDLITNTTGMTIPENGEDYYAVFAESGGTPTTLWSKTDVSDLKDGDEVVLVMNNGSNYTLNDDNGTGSAPAATSINIENDCLKDSPIAEKLSWILGKDGDNLTFYKDANKATWLYCTNTNNGVRVGTNENKTFTIDTSNGYLINTGTSRYIGIYNSQDWRCYTSTTTNIGNQTLAFYKKTTTGGYQNYTTECSTPTEFTVYFDANGHGTAPDEQIVASGQTATEPTPAPTATGYIFGGWYKESECENEFDFNTGITAHITLYAKWTPITYTVSFDNNGGTGTMDSQTLTYNQAQTLTANTFTRTGYTFNGWNTQANGQGTNYTDKQSVKNLASTNGATITLYAQWKIQTFTVTFNSNGGTGTMVSQPFTYNVAQNLTSNTFTRTGYTFNGWNTQANGQGTTYTDQQSVTLTTAGLTLYAQWKANTYTVAFNANGGTGSMSNQSFTYGQSQSLTANAFTRTNYAFKNWNTKADGSGANYTDKQSVSNLTTTNGETITLYAQWTPTYTIIWLANGQEFHTQTAVEGTVLDLPDSEPYAASYACDDKVFVGWTATQINGSTDTEPADLFKSKTDKVENAATTYYAVFATVEDEGSSAELVKMTADDDFNIGDKLVIIAEGTRYGLYQKTSTSNYIDYWTTEDKDGVPTLAEIEEDSKKYVEVSVGTATGTIKLGDATNGYLYNSSSTNMLISTSNSSDWSIIAWTDDTFTFEAGQYLSCRTDLSSANENKWRGAGSNCNCETGTNCSGVIYYNVYKYISGSTASYSDYTTTCVKLPDPVLTFATEPANPIEFTDAVCGGNSSKQSVTVVGENLRDVVKVSVTGPYKIARTASTALKDFTTSLTLDKTAAGAIHSNYQTVYIISTPPAQSTEATTGTLTFTTTKGNTLTVNLSTPTVTCAQYTLTLVDRGVSTEQPTKYYAGETIDEAPADPEGVCTDPIHYVFDGWAAATVAEGSTTYTKVSFPYTVTGNTKFYAVYRYVEEGSGDGNYYLVENDLGSQWAGEYLIVSGTKAFDGSLSSLDVTGNNFDVTISNKTIEATDEINQKTFTIKSVEEYYTIQSKSGKYIGAFATGNLNNNTEVYDDRFYHTLGIGSPNNKALIYSNKGAGVELQTNGGRFRYYNKNSQTAVYLYKKSSGTTYYTTSPVCGPHLAITEGKEIYVTGGNAQAARDLVMAQQKVSYKATRLNTKDGSAGGTAPDVVVADNGITKNGIVTSEVKVTFENTIKEQQADGTYTITGDIVVTYEAEANNLKEDIQVQLAADYNAEAKDNFTVHARSLPSEFVIVAKSGDKWYALNADMSSSKAQPANGQVTLNDLNNPTEATFAPCNAIYTFEAMPQGAEDRISVRFIGQDNKYLWAASGINTGIQNNSTNPAADALAYNWKLYTEDNITYRFGNANSNRQLTLNGEKFGMYTSGVQDIRILPYEAKCLYNYAPSNLKVSVLKGTYVTLTWDAVAGATKYQYSTDATNWTDCGTEPTVTINDLEGATKYTYYIRAYHEDAGVSQECIDYAEITFTTANCDDVPTNITYTADLNSITVSWTAAAPTATIKLFMDEEGAHMAGSYPGAKSPYKISGGLNKNTTYYIQILADGTCASPIIPVKTEDVKVDIVEWKTDGIIVDINTNEKIGVTLENEVSYGSGSGSLAEDLFFSKYFEGSGSLKMIAIYNGTGKDVDLTDYFIYKGHNGSANFDEDDQDKISYPLSELGVIKQGQEIVLYSWSLNTNEEASVYSCSQTFLHSIANESGQDANPRWILCGKDPTNSITPIYSDAMNFNGDDPLLLYKDGEIIDVFGATNGESPENNVICDGYNENGNYKTRSDESWVANDVSNMDYGKTAEDFPNGEIPDDVNVADPTITAYTARVIMFRKNSVTSGANAVTKNTDDFHTFAEEWEVRQVCRISGDGDLTCAAYQELGTFDYSNYYTKYETMGDEQVFDVNQRNEDGTVNVEILNLDKQSCRNIRVKLTNEDGEVLSDREYKVPIMITTSQGTDGQAFLALQENLATVEVDGSGNPTGNKTNLTLEQVREICKTCDVVVRDNATLTKIADDAANDHPEVHDIYIYENSSLIVPNGTNYTINNLSLRRKQDAVASVSTHPDALKLPESAAAPISLDFRLSAENWHWFTLPYNCNINEVTWIDGTPAQYNVDWFLMTYDGEKRAATQAGGCWKAYTGTTIKAGEGFILAINGNINNPAHTYELRFPMSKEVLVNEGTDKTVDVRAWGVETNIRPNHKGWNLVGNPYLAYYQRNNITNFEGLRLGQLTGPDPQTGYWEQTGDVPYVVVPVGAGWIAYEQVLASETDLLPFTAYFVQVGNDGKHESDDELSIEFDHTKLQLSATPMPASIIQRSATEASEPVIVGVSLTNAKGESDKTSLIIDNQYTNEYEMHADFFKWFGDYYKYYTKPVLYTVGADQGKRAFNAISEDLASQPISLGMYAAQAGNYTFSLDLRSDLSKVQEVWLYDATQDTYTNLMQDSYTFNTAKTESAGRFFLSVKMAPKVSTDINNVTDGTIWATTQDHTIFVNGLLSNAQLWIYDATGKLLHTDQTQYYQHTYQVPVSGTYFVRVQNTMQTQTIKVVVE